MKKEYSCLMCGTTVTRYEREVAKSGRVFCGIECRTNYFTKENHHSWNSIVVNCAQCLREILIPQYKTKRVHHFCSNDCKKKYLVQKNSPAWKGGKVLVDCETCNIAFELSHKDAKKSKKHYCSRVCFFLDPNTCNFKEDKNYRWSGGLHERICTVCGKLFFYFISRDNVGKGKYCSVECCAKGRIKIKDSQERQHILNNRKILRASLEYKEWKFAVLKRDKRRCVNCGAHKHLQVHHIIPITEDITKAIDINNGQTLCWCCHLETHNKQLRAKMVQK